MSSESFKNPFENSEEDEDVMIALEPTATTYAQQQSLPEPVEVKPTPASSMFDPITDHLHNETE